MDCAGKYLGLITFLLLVIPVQSWTYTDAGTLRSDLLASYVKSIRPSKLTSVDLQMGMSSLNGLDIVEQTLDIQGFLLLKWSDPQLAWTPSSYNNMASTHMLASEVWLPPMVLNNAATDIKILSDNTDLTSVPLKVFSSGTVYWLLPGRFQASCTVDITYYPFDEQECTVMVSTWMYDTSELDFNIIDTINTDLYEENGEWSYDKGWASITTRSIHGLEMSSTQFTMKFSRRHQYYIINVILPVVFLSTLGFLVFLLPVDSGERNGFALTVLLSLSVVLASVSVSIPTTSTSTCVLSVYLLITFVISSIEAVLTVITVRLYLQDGSDVTLKPRLNSLMNNFLVPLTRYRKFNEACDDDRVKALQMVEINQDGTNDKTNNGNIKEDIKDAWKDEDSNINEARNEDYTYKDLSKVLDIIYFFVFMFITVVLSLVIFIFLVRGS